ncbi:DHA2 family efflux MFS transporter permease subunit [Acidipropionibacterium virtanenii]|uniref:Multidrug resistance protein Stp n=1 Tax=Acidipropionibacterium virtanenii TaxID=2057246 RepID=A0A344URH7_9ACTN|nr:DHA2 family efflux MFS transporter permease subunit [Acidipropionibacterium virtanenii]AXE37875.1 Multidrug resistance protein Stp [Acidipropionibacterium virtanenii]
MNQQASNQPASDLARDRFGHEVTVKRAWSALWAVIIGFFMLMVDQTIVTTALPATIRALGTDLTGGVWVTSSYLLTYAVPLLISGRLGDRFGPRNVYLAGMAIFTVASLACGLSVNIEMLIASRALQGIGAALMSPQSMTVITRLFPARSRGAAMGIWGATAGVAGFVGPILGGLLVDAIGWEWVFFVNVPVGIFGMWRAWVAVPELERRSRSLDWVGVALSGIAMALLVFGIQEGERFDWGTISGILSVPLLIGLGVLIMGAFVISQTRWSRTRGGRTKGAETSDPLLPLGLFRNWNFTLANLAIFFVGMTVTAMSLPTAVYLQQARGLSPTMAALVLVPTALFSGVLSPLVGKHLNRFRSGRIAMVGTGLTALANLGWALTMNSTTAFWVFCILAGVMGIGAAHMWSPISLTCTHDLRPDDAGAGSGVYNAVRQVGSVLGSALIAMMMDARVAARHDLARGLGDSLLLPAACAACATVCALLFRAYSRGSRV